MDYRNLGYDGGGNDDDDNEEYLQRVSQILQSMGMRVVGAGYASNGYSNSRRGTSMGTERSKYTSMYSTDTKEDDQNAVSTPSELMLDTTYTVSVARPRDTDAFAVSLLATRFEEGTIPSKLVPMITVGDGKCFLHAVSMFLMGSDNYDTQLRTMLLNEVKENKQFYLDTVVAAHMVLFKDDQDLKDEEKKKKKMDEIYEELIQSCSGKAVNRENWSGMEEAFVLANAIKRPIIVYANKNDVREFGEGIMGVGGAFLPLRHKPEECVCKLPILISWSNLGLHFCPLIHVSNWTGDPSRHIGFPRVQPALIKECSFSGDPLNTSGDLSTDEEAAMEQYVDYYETIKKPPQQKVVTTTNQSLLKTLEFYNQPIDGLEKTLNPEDQRYYDIVIPVDFGEVVHYIAFDLGGDFSAIVEGFGSVYCKGDTRSISLMYDYILKVLYRLKVVQVRYLQEISGVSLPSSSGTHCPPPKLADYVPLRLDASIPCTNEDMSFVASSAGTDPGIPVAVPCRFEEEVSSRAVDGMMKAVENKYHSESNTTIECVYMLQDYMSVLLSKKDLPKSELQSYPPVNWGILLPCLCVSANYKSFELFELFRYYALDPTLCSFMGPTLTEWCRVPDDKDPFCVHLAFIRMMANILSNSLATRVNEDYDLLKDLTDSLEFMQYFERASKSKSTELLTSLSILFLDIVVMNGFSPLNLKVARLYPRILLTALRQEQKPLLRNIVLGMSTLLYNDKASVQVLKSCPSIHTLLEKAEAMLPEKEKPYASFCTSALSEQQ